MLKLHYAAAASLTALCANAFALEDPASPKQSSTDAEWFSVGTGGSGAAFFGLRSAGMAPLSLGGESTRPTASHFRYGTTFNDGTVLRLGMLTQVATAPSSLCELLTPGAARSLNTVEVQRTFGEFTGAITLSHLREGNSVPWLNGSGAPVLGAGSNTTFVTLAGSRPVSQKSTFSATATLGQGAAYENTQASPIGGAGFSRTADWSFGLAQKDVLREGDLLGLTMAIPFRTISTPMQVSTAVAQSQVDGTLQYATQAMSLQPTGTEKDLELAYATPMRFGGNLTALAQVKLQPGHDAQAPAQFGLGLRYRRAFN